MSHPGTGWTPAEEDLGSLQDHARRQCQMSHFGLHLLGVLGPAQQIHQAGWGALGIFVGGKGKATGDL